jgi:hypothetical protein
MKRIFLWSVLVTAVFATDGSIYIAEAETKGPGRKSENLVYRIQHFDLTLNCFPPSHNSYLFNYGLTTRQRVLPFPSKSVFLLKT